MSNKLIVSDAEDDDIVSFCELFNYDESIKNSFKDHNITNFSELFESVAQQAWLKSLIMKSDGKRWTLREKKTFLEDLETYILEQRKLYDSNVILNTSNSNLSDQELEKETLNVDDHDTSTSKSESNDFNIVFLNSQVIYTLDLNGVNLKFTNLETNQTERVLGEENQFCITKNGRFNPSRFDFQVNKWQAEISFFVLNSSGLCNLETFKELIENCTLYKEPIDIIFVLNKCSNYISDLLSYLFPYEVPPDILVAISSRFFTLFPLLDLLYEEFVCDEKKSEVKVNGKLLTEQTASEYLSSKIKNKFKSRGTTLKDFGLWVWSPKERKIKDPSVPEVIELSLKTNARAHRGKQVSKLLSSAIFEDDEDIDLFKNGFLYQRKKRVYELFDEHQLSSKKTCNN